MSSQDPSIQIFDVERSYASTAGLDSLGRIIAFQASYLRVEAGQRVGVIGRNGAGKSTLMRLISGIEPPSSGTVEVIGRVTAVLTLGVGLREDLDGRENIRIDGRIRGLTDLEIERAMASVVDFAELGDFIDRPVRIYSTGMKARLAFAMISQMEPEILVIDEALSVGDAAFARKAAARIREICDRGRIVIVVSHSMQSIREICNRCLWVDRGRIVMDGEPSDVVAAYEEAVRHADEAALRNRFRAREGARSLAVGWSLGPVEIRQQGQDNDHSMLESGRDVTFTTRLERPVASVPSIVEYQITRLDEVRLLQRTVEVHSQSSASIIRLHLPELPLWLGIYRLDVQVRVFNTPMATSARVFEVFSKETLAGGRPMIRPRLHLRSEPRPLRKRET